MHPFILTTTLTSWGTQVIVGILRKNIWPKIHGIAAKSLLINFCACLKQNDVCWSDVRALSVNAVHWSLYRDLTLRGPWAYSQNRWTWVLRALDTAFPWLNNLEFCSFSNNKGISTSTPSMWLVLALNCPH